LLKKIYLGTQKFPELLKKLFRDSKIPGIVKKNCLKCLYKFETLVPFEALPLRLDAAIPALLPMLETLSKIFNGNAVKGCQRFSSNLCNVSKVLALQMLPHNRIVHNDVLLPI